MRGLVVEYDGTEVLHGVDFAVDEGELVVVLGTNGSGKSSLLRAITGVTRPARGRVTIAGRDTTRWAPERIATLGMAMVPGGRGVFPSLSVAQHLRLARWRAGDRASVEAALDRFPVLRTRLGQAAGNLSGGEQHMLALAMALVMRPRLLLVDELTLGLAPEAVDHVVNVMCAERDEGTTVVVVEQSIERARAFADRVCFLDRGVVRYEGTVDGLLAQPDMVRSVFLGDASAAVGTSRVSPPADDTPAPDTERLAVRDVSKHYGGVDALVDVSLRVGEREIVGIVGGNGAGKTTLLDVVSGFARADDGTVTFHDRAGSAHDVTGTPAPVRARLGMGRTFQDGRLFPALSAEETVAVALEHAVRVRDPVAAALYLPAARRSERAIRARVEELLVLLNLGDYADQFVHELSTGTRRVVELAGVLAHDPELLLLDEPSSGLAQAETEALAPLLLGVRDRSGTTILLVDHDLALVRAVATRVVTMELGRVVAER